MRRDHRRLRTLGPVLAALILAMPARAPAAGDAAAGQRLAEQWCRSCHLIAPGEGRTSDGAPAFQAVAEDPATTADGLRAWLFSPHPPMPNFDLSQREIDDLTAYILSLAPQ